jgi:ABC-type branched-subunit amino acid transport system ATPase component/branched-subunit amino acid ABC-type transport system permease component
MREFWIFAVTGLAGGSAYGLNGLGVTAIYRGSRVLNLGHAAFGIVGAFAFYSLWDNGTGLPVAAAMPLAILIAAICGALVYLVVIGPMRDSTEMNKSIATLGLLLIAQGIAYLAYGPRLITVPQFLDPGSFDIGGAALRHITLIVIILGILLAGGLTLLFNRTRFGLAVAGLQERPDTAAVLGISPVPAGIATWSLGAALSAAAAILLVPTVGLSSGNLSLLLFPALSAALIGRFRNFWLTFGGGLMIGVIESVLLLYNVPPQFVDSIPFAIILVGIFLGGSAIPGRGFSVARFPRTTTGQIRWRLAIFWLVVLVLSALFFGSGWATGLTASALVTLVALAVVVATGYMGQFSLAPLAMAGIGELVLANAVGRWNWPVLPSVILAVIAAGVAGGIIGILASRVRGVDFAVGTIGIALLVENAVFQTPALVTVNGISIPPLHIFGYSLEPGAYPQRFTILCLLVAAVAVTLVTALRRSATGRRLLAVRVNERGAASLGISISSVKIGGLAIAGAIAGVAGVLMTFQQSYAQFNSFDIGTSITIIAFTILGGIGYPMGAVVAGVAATGGVMAYIVGTYVSSINDYLILISGVALIQTLITNPGGAAPVIAGQVAWLMRYPRRLLAAVNWPGTATKRAASPSEGAVQATETAQCAAHSNGWAWAPPVAEPSGGAPALEVEDASVHYGALTALEGISFRLQPGTVLGIVGPNGAGKTTLIDAISGYARARGRFRVCGEDVTNRRPHIRAHAGIGRTFQNLELFAGLTTGEHLMIARERAGKKPRHARTKADLYTQIAACLVTFGLLEYRNREVQTLPQGIQHLVALSRSLFVGSSVLLLDEPAAGLSDQERRTMVRTLREFVARTGMAVVVVEHNLDVIRQLADELIVLNFGRVIAQGQPEQVLASDVVRDAYLGSLEHGSSQAETSQSSTTVEADVK